MNFIVSRLKRSRFGKILGVVLASCLLFISTACAGSAQATGPDTSSQTNNPAKAYNVKENAPEGGMNRYKDVDPRQGDLGAAAKEKGSVDRTKRNLTGNNDVIENVKEATDNVRRDTVRGARDLGNKVQNAAEDAANTVKNAADNAVQDAGNLSRSAEKLVNQAPDPTAARAQKEKENIYQARQQVLDAKEAVENAAD